MALPEVVVYWDKDFRGASWRTNLNYSYVGGYWNDRISSIIVVSGIWEFYEHKDYGGWAVRLGPGYYHWVEEVGIPNDKISSFKCISLENLSLTAVKDVNEVPTATDGPNMV